MGNALKIALALALAGMLHWLLFVRPLGHADGVLVAEAPVQKPPRDARPITHGDFTLRPLADFELEARVLSRADYRFDGGAALSPTDLALGWGRMSDSGVIRKLDLSQSVRFYSYRWRDAPPIPPDEITRSSANMHLIPADRVVERALARVRTGHLVHLRGRLVEARRADGWRWTSSLTRDDSGAGACELVWVEELETR